MSKNKARTQNEGESTSLDLLSIPKVSVFIINLKVAIFHVLHGLTNLHVENKRTGNKNLVNLVKYWINSHSPISDMAVESMCLHSIQHSL